MIGHIFKESLTQYRKQCSICDKMLGVCNSWTHLSNNREPALLFIQQLEARLAISQRSGRGLGNSNCGCVGRSFSVDDINKSLSLYDCVFAQGHVP